MRVKSVIAVVVRGEGMVSGRSGMEVVKRIMRVRGGKDGGEGEEAIAYTVGGKLCLGLCSEPYVIGKSRITLAGHQYWYHYQVQY